MVARRNIIYIILVCALNINAQGGWKKRYLLPNSGANLPWAVFECPNGDFIQVGITLDTLNSQFEYKLTTMCTNPQGDLLWVKSTSGGKYIYLDCFSSRSLISDTNGFHLVTTVVDPTNRQIGMLIKLNLNGDTIWRKIYSDPNPAEDVILYSVSKSFDGGFLMTGFFQNSNYMACLVIKTNSGGDEIWRKKIHKAYPDVQAGIAIVQDSLTKRIVVVGYQYLVFSQGIGTNSNILILDEFGNKLIQKTMNNYDGGAFGDVIQLKDKSFLACGSANANSDYGSYPRYYSTVVKFDVSGNVAWTQLYDVPSLYNRIDILREEPGGEIMMAGFLDTLRNYNLDVIQKLKVFRTDKNGNIKWKRNVGHSYDHKTSEGPLTMRPTGDGGFIFATRFPYETNPRFYGIIKIDSTGCDTLESWCKSVILDLNEFGKAFDYHSEFFPNPANDLLSLKLETSLPKAFTVKISDISGKIIAVLEMNSEEKIELNTANYEEGIYLLTVFCENRRVETKKLVVIH